MDDRLTAAFEQARELASLSRAWEAIIVVTDAEVEAVLLRLVDSD